jgi:hypothetical protein
VSGRPGLGESSAGTNDWSIPLGSYAGTRSAYGLLDLSGGAREWLDDIRPTEVDTLRYFDGASVGDRYIGDDAELSLDRASRFGSDDPTFNPFGVGVRIASIPASAAGLLCGPMWLFTARRKRR